MEKTSIKVVLAGLYFKTSRYRWPISYNFTKVKKQRLPKEKKSVITDIQKQKNMQDAIFRAKMTLRHLVAANAVGYINPDTNLPYKPLFLTLTFKEPVEDLQQANGEFKKFIKRLNYSLGLELKYLTVPEIQMKRFQKYGVKVWHFHTIFFNLPYINLGGSSVNEYFGSIWDK